MPQITIDMEKASDRHFRDGKRLLDAHCMDNAGYHFGFAAECAVKALMQRRGISEARSVSVQGEDRRGAFWEHFPQLRSSVLEQEGGRGGAELLALVNRQSFMSNWDIRMRYAQTGTVSREAAERWKSDANAAAALLI